MFDSGLDFVDVVGQDINQEVETAAISKKLESLRIKLQRQIEKGDEDNAKRTVSEIEKLMNDYSFEYKKDN